MQVAMRLFSQQTNLYPHTANVSFYFLGFITQFNHFLRSYGREKDNTHTILDRIISWFLVHKIVTVLTPE